MDGDQGFRDDWGYSEKQAAALEAGAGLVVIEKPEEETGYSWEEICSLLTEELGLVPHWQVTVAGIGPGGEEGFTREAWEACRSAGLLIGAERMLKAAAVPGQKTYAAYDPGEILSCIHAHPEEEQVTVALSGDIGFYSGARKLEEALGEDPRIQVRLVPGVASAVVFAARMGIPWEDVAFASIHGRKCSPISLIRENQKTMILAGSREGVKELGSLLVEFGLGGIRAIVGTRLSYPEEKILRGDGNMLREYDGDGLALIYLENLQGGKEPAVPGRPDGTFLRGEVPMTKEEVRSVSLAKLRPGRDWVIDDIGAGTGSVAVEAALAAWQGQVYAIERKREALDLIRENARRFGTDNVTVVPGEAPEALDGLPAPDGVFIGGSGGKLPEILEAVFAKNPKARVVLNAVTLETVAEAVACMKKWNLQEEEVVQLNVSRARRAGAYHLMDGPEPYLYHQYDRRRRNMGRVPRLLIGAARSGPGKTLITCALLKALQKRKKQAVSFKSSGPDYIDPLFHREALGIDSDNLDSFLCTPDQVRALLAERTGNCEIAVLEGVMGYYDGLGGMKEEASTYDIARITGTPAVLVVDARGPACRFCL